jgi:hypothetical protein
MLPGPQLIYQCPACKGLLAKGSLMSGNTFGGTFYSDGRFFAPMLPQFPQISKCAECNHIFWLNEKNLMETIDWNDPDFNRFEKVPDADFLRLEDYIQLIQQKFYMDSEEERFLRFEVWRGFNDKKRAGKELWNSENEQLIWQENLETLITLIQPEWEQESLTLAELHRNFGRFEKALEILSEIRDKRHKETVQKLMAECRKKNKEVIKY